MPVGIYHHIQGAAAQRASGVWMVVASAPIAAAMMPSSRVSPALGSNAVPNATLTDPTTGKGLVLAERRGAQVVECCPERCLSINSKARRLGS